MSEARPIKRIMFLALAVLALSGFYVRSLYELSISARPVEADVMTETQPVYARRGDIVDRNGVVISGSRLAFSVGVNRLWYRGNPGQKLERVNEILGSSLESVPDDGILAKGITREQAALIEQSRIFLTGVEVYTSYVRDYPLAIAPHTVGQIGPIWAEEYQNLSQMGYELNSLIGREGIEKSYEDVLRGHDGSRRVELDEAGRIIGIISETPAEDGSTVVLTIDAALQQRLEELLAQTIEDLDTGMGGAAVALSVKTWETIAIASYPDYEVENYSKNYAELSADPRSPLFNRAISGLYAPGSVFKMLTAVAALETKTITTKTMIEDEGIYTHYEEAGYAPRCWLYRKNGTTHGELDVVGAIKHSCNYFFYETGRKTGISAIDSYAERFGLGIKTGIELPGEAAGVLAGPASCGGTWYDGDTLGASIGQSDHQFTPIQLARYIATLAGGGIKYRPHIIKEIRSPEGETLVSAGNEIEDVIPISNSNLTAVLEGMKEVTEDGTASLAFKGYPISVGGKTGSVQVAEGKPDNGVFAAFAPFEDPEVVIVIIAEGAGTGGVLGYAARDFFNACFGVEEAREEEAGEAPSDISEADRALEEETGP